MNSDSYLIYLDCIMKEILINNALECDETIQKYL